MEYGTLPDWLAGAGTVGALGVALVLLSQDLRARREVEEDRRRAQASRVVCWLASRGERDRPPPPSSWLSPASLEVVLHNGSDEPVFDCRVYVELDPQTPERFQFDPAAPQTVDHSGRRRRLTERMLPPSRTYRPIGLGAATLPHASVWMVFTDASNRRWQRGHSGRLSRMVDRREESGGSLRVGPGALWYGPVNPH